MEKNQITCQAASGNLKDTYFPELKELMNEESKIDLRKIK
jgi:hypothetical protein